MQVCTTGEKIWGFGGCGNTGRGSAHSGNRSCVFFCVGHTEKWKEEENGCQKDGTTIHLLHPLSAGNSLIRECCCGKTLDFLSSWEETRPQTWVPPSSSGRKTTTGALPPLSISPPRQTQSHDRILQVNQPVGLSCRMGPVQGLFHAEGPLVVAAVQAPRRRTPVSTRRSDSPCGGWPHECAVWGLGEVGGNSHPREGEGPPPA